jgi:predicted nuclease of predicted toxin-antitoxin system
MKILADAHISRLMVQYLQSLGHEVLHAGALQPRLSDSAIMRIAAGGNWIILTADRDYGELVFRRLIPSDGVILLRLSAAHEPERLAVFREL